MPWWCVGAAAHPAVAMEKSNISVGFGFRGGRLGAFVGLVAGRVDVWIKEALFSHLMINKISSRAVSSVAPIHSDVVRQVHAQIESTWSNVGQSHQGLIQ